MSSFDPTAILEQSVRSSAVEIHDPGLFRQFVAFLREFAATAFDAYRPELHYMRGPGPAWHAKHRGTRKSSYGFAQSAASSSKSRSPA